MPLDPPGRLTLPPPSFPQGPQRNEMLDLESPTVATAPRVSFGHYSYRRPSHGSHAKFGPLDEEMGGAEPPIFELPPIPTAISKGDDNPLPKLPMIVLSIAMLGEFLSANVSASFLLFMVESFGVEQSQVGSLTGILVSMFFVTQFLTSLLWATVADKHGRRAVLFVSLLGTALTCFAFGTSTTFSQAVVIRLLQGIFGGSVGVARGAVSVVTDSSNEARAYAILGFCWGLGGVAGAVIGGALENPAGKWPNGVGSYPILIQYPYLLPCAVASSVTFTGAVLSLFLGWDGGAREGLIRLPEEKDTAADGGASDIGEGNISPNVDSLTELSPSHNVVGDLKQKVTKKLSGYFARRVRDAHDGHSPLNSPSVQSLNSPQALQVPRQKDRSYSRASRASRNGPGSAYGYSGGMRNRLPGSVAGGDPSSFTGSMGILRRRRFTGQTENGETDGDLNFAQRLLMATEGNVTNMANLWVAAAINTDNETPFTESDDEDDDHESVFLEDGAETPLHPQTPPRSRPSSQSRDRRPSGNRGGFPGGMTITPIRHLSMTPHRPSASSPHRTLQLSSTPNVSSPLSQQTGVQLEHLHSAQRRGSSVSRAYLPAIYGNTGLSDPPALAFDPELTPTTAESPNAPSTLGERLALPFKGKSRSRSPAHHPQTAIGEPDVLPVISERDSVTDGKESTVEERSLWSQLPLVMIFQYGLLALHNTIHDQYFLSYLVSPYKTGGLGLDAGHFAQLIAMMCLAQIAYQFYLYPNIGPPRGPWSHLAMFRLGAILFIPSYLTVCLYRVFASEGDDGNALVMTLLALSTAVRYCGTTFAYTAIAILLNYMSPPHLVSYSNSLAQSTVAFARFVGPVLGGYLWSASVKDNPSGYPYGFYICSLLCAFGVLHSFTIR